MASHDSFVLTGPTWKRGSGWGTIVDMRGDDVRIFDLEGLLFDVFKACEEVITLKELCIQMPHRDHVELSQALDELVSYGLLFRDGSRYVSVAVHAHAS